MKFARTFRTYREMERRINRRIEEAGERAIRNNEKMFVKTGNTAYLSRDALKRLGLWTQSDEAASHAPPLSCY